METVPMTDMLHSPCVFMLEDCYQIAFVTARTGMAWVQVGERTYADSVAGIMRWDDTLHKVEVPRAELDAAGGYTVRFAAMDERKTYYPEHGPVQERGYAFRPVPDGEPLRLYFMGDIHDRVDEAIACAKRWPDALPVYGGDATEGCAEPDRLCMIQRIDSGISGGTRPVLFVRGNHDTRGALAHLLPRCTPVRDGRTYYTFRAGDTWGIVLDCGEDKYDHNIEYGDTIWFNEFRERETEWLRGIAAQRPWSDARHRIAICHSPFTMSFRHPFDVGSETWREWVGLLNDMGIELMVCGHMHEVAVVRPGDPDDAHGQQFTVTVASGICDGAFAGGLVELGDVNRLSVNDAGGMLYIDAQEL